MRLCTRRPFRRSSLFALVLAFFSINPRISAACADRPSLADVRKATHDGYVRREIVVNLVSVRVKIPFEIFQKRLRMRLLPRHFVIVNRYFALRPHTRPINPLVRLALGGPARFPQDLNRRFVLNFFG